MSRLSNHHRWSLVSPLSFFVLCMRRDCSGKCRSIPVSPLFLLAGFCCIHAPSRLRFPVPTASLSISFRSLSLTSTLFYLCSSSPSSSSYISLACRYGAYYRPIALLFWTRCCDCHHASIQPSSRPSLVNTGITLAPRCRAFPTASHLS